MCYNCSCGLPDDDMGAGHALSDPDGKSITDHTFHHLAADWKMSDNEAKELVYQMLTGQKKDSAKEQFMEHLYEEAGKSQGMSVEQSKDETRTLLKIVLRH